MTTTISRLLGGSFKGVVVYNQDDDYLNLGDLPDDLSLADQIRFRSSKTITRPIAILLC